MDYSNFKIAIDGPASSGKSTIAKILAEDLKLVYVDTGAMYRALTYLAIKNEIEIENENDLVNLLKQIEITFERTEKGQLVFVNGEDVTKEIRQHNVTNNVSVVSSFSKVRKELVRRQQQLAEFSGVVMDGRDIGTVVLPNADVKIFLVADVAQRAERRYLENKENGIVSDFNQLKQDIINRDRYDSNREVSPLIQAEDAILLDTTSLTIDQVVEKCKTIIQNI